MAYVDDLVAKKNNIHLQQKELLERCAREGRRRSEEELADYARMDADYESADREITDILTSQKRAAEADAFRETLAPIVTPDQDARQSIAQVSDLQRFIGTRGAAPIEVDLSGAARIHQAIRSGMSPAEARSIVSDTGAGSLVVPTQFESQLYQYWEASSAIRSLARVIQTSNGDPISFPRVGTHAIGTQVIAQGTAIGGTDPTFALMTLSAFKYGELVQISRETTTDAMFDIVGFIAENVGRALGRITDTAYVTGNGTSAPNGVITAAGTGVKTGGSLVALTVENLIDLQHSIVSEYRDNATWVFNDSTAGTLRKIREDGGTSGAFLWQPSTQAGVPDVFLGSPVKTDGNFASQGSAARAVAYGDFRSFFVRDAGPVRFERSDEFAFNTDLVSFRGVVRTDSDLIDTNAIKTSSQSV